jgi:hypothetical protein
MPVLDDPEPEEPWGVPPAVVSIAELAAVLEAIEQYQQNGGTKAQLRTLRALWLERITLREHARREGVSAAAIHARIHGTKGAGGLFKAVPKFAEFWMSPNGNRRSR